MLQFDAPAEPGSIALAREAVRACDAIPPSFADDAAVVVSELFTNAVRHAGLKPTDSVHLTVAREQDAGREVVTIEVQDHGPGIDPDAVPSGEPTDHGGFGLKIVEALSYSWGFAPGGRVWARLMLANLGPRAPRS